MKKFYSLLFTMLLAFVGAEGAWGQLSLEDGAKYYLKYNTQYVYKDVTFGVAGLTDDESQATKFVIVNTVMGYTFTSDEGSLAIDSYDCVFSDTPEYFDIFNSNESFSIGYITSYLTKMGDYVSVDTDEDTSWSIEKVGGAPTETIKQYCRLVSGANHTYLASPNIQNGSVVTSGYGLKDVEFNATDYNNIWISETTDNVNFKFRHANSGLLLGTDRMGSTTLNEGENFTPSENKININGVDYSITPITSVNYTLNNSGFGTLCLPFNFSVSAGLTVNIVTGSGDVLNVVPVSGNLKAKEGYIMIGTPGETYTLTIQDEADANSANLLSGTTCREIGLTDGEFYGLKTTAGQSGEKGSAVFAKSTISEFPANKAYLLASKLATSSNSLLSLNFDVNESELTNIHEIFNLKNDSPVYDLQGRRVSASAHGLFIQNGKKVFNK